MLEEVMRRAIIAAATTRPHPNPRVGAVVLDRDLNVVGKGVHRGPGEPHAEIVALERAGAAARGGTVVVTLEPCSHHGRTAPCTEALVAAGVARVAFGAHDPDPRVDGQGASALRAAGIDVVAGVLAGAVEAADPGYFHHRRHGRPRVTVKAAATLDGQTAAGDGSSQWITSEASRHDAHQLRASVDAVVVGAGTVRRDDPRLTVRLPGYDGEQPVPVVVAGDGPLSADASVFDGKALVYSAEPRDLPAEVVVVERAPGGVDLTAVVTDLGERGMLDLLVEGGATLAGALHRLGLIDRYVLYLGALLAGGTGAPVLAGEFPTLDAARPAAIRGVERLDGDLRLELVPERS